MAESDDGGGMRWSEGEDSAGMRCSSSAESCGMRCSDGEVPRTSTTGSRQDVERKDSLVVGDMMLDGSSSGEEAESPRLAPQPPRHVRRQGLASRRGDELPRFGQSPGHGSVLAMPAPHGLHRFSTQCWRLRQARNANWELVPRRPGSRQLRPGEEPSIRVMGTLRVFGASHSTGTALTVRNCRELAACLRFHPEYADTMERSALQWKDRKVVSVEFAEWFMGSPQGWTGVSAVHPEAREVHPISRYRLRHGSKHKTLSLFTGVGLLDWGLSPWCEPLMFVERDPAKVRVLQARMADGSLACRPVVSDVREVHRGTLAEQVDGIVAGFPCQSISVAGGRLGLQGASGIVTEVWRLIDTFAVSFVFLENVNNLRFLERVWRPVFEALWARSFQLRWATLDGENVGVRQRRRRFFLLGCRGSYARRGGPFDDALDGPDMASLLARETDDAFNPPGRPPMENWLSARGHVDGTRLQMLGDAVIPLQAFLAARLLARPEWHACTDPADRAFPGGEGVTASFPERS